MSREMKQQLAGEEAHVCADRHLSRMKHGHVRRAERPTGAVSLNRAWGVSSVQVGRLAIGGNLASSSGTGGKRSPRGAGAGEGICRSCLLAASVFSVK